MNAVQGSRPGNSWILYITVDDEEYLRSRIQCWFPVGFVTYFPSLFWQHQVHSNGESSSFFMRAKVAATSLACARFGTISFSLLRPAAWRKIQDSKSPDQWELFGRLDAPLFLIIIIKLCVFVLWFPEIFWSAGQVKRRNYSVEI